MLPSSSLLLCVIVLASRSANAFVSPGTTYNRPVPLLATRVNLRLVGLEKKDEFADIQQQQHPPESDALRLTKFQQHNVPEGALNHQNFDFKDVPFAAVAGGLLMGLATLGLSTNVVPHSDVIGAVQNFFHDPTSSLEAVVSRVEAMGPTGALYFGLAYTIAEVLAIPAFPLTASAGYLFGVGMGTSVVLVSASIAAAISFVIGRTVLRSYVENLLEDYPDFKKIDKAIGKEGFKLMLLLRMSPVFPFALSNYLYGASSVEFWPYFFGTMIGFTPGTIAYVYSGQVGKALTLGDGSSQPWYIYLGSFALLSGFLKLLADAATGIIEEIEENE
jgi:uncharacterized membrane protein YdjX (TVP38/TMEM64 family)